MIRVRRISTTLCVFVICLISAINAWADTVMDVEYAEMQPLSADSMLLDVIRVDDRLVAVGERGHVVFSDDGKTWQQAEHVPTRSTLTSLFRVGDRLWAAGHDAVIITSGDRGATWTREHFDPDRQQAIMDIYFTDKDHGVAIGSYALVLATDDGGQTWADAAMVDEESDYHLNAMVRFSDGRRMIAGEAGYSYRSFDDGASWEMMNMPYMGSMWGAIAMPHDCVVFFGLRGHAMESCDFGTTWQELDTGTLASLSGAADRDGLIIMVGNSGTILTRVNGSMTEYSLSSGVDFAAVVPLDDGRFLLVGEKGVHWYPESQQDDSDG
jgi:photosystem II stability/assembly factor-like uncharacterized protein